MENEMKKIKKVSKVVKDTKEEKTYKSISEINFDLIQKNVSFDDILKVVKKNFPDSKYQKTHYSWYKQRIKKQKELNLDLNHLKFSTSKIYDLLEEKNNLKEKKFEKKVKKIVKK